METYIVDASVGVKWFFNEEFSDTARRLLYHLGKREIKLIVPEVFYAELGNVFCKRIRGKQISSAAAHDAFDSLIGLRLRRYSDCELSDVALENAIQFEISSYDAIYISLAEIYGAPLITADDTLIKACEDQFDFILPLKEFKE